MKFTLVALRDRDDRDIARVMIPDDDATVEAIARSAADMILGRGALVVGDRIVIEEYNEVA